MPAVLKNTSRKAKSQLKSKKTGLDTDETSHATSKMHRVITPDFVARKIACNESGSTSERTSNILSCIHHL